MLMLPFSEDTARQVAADDESAFLKALISLASSWMDAAGGSVGDRNEIMATTCLSCPDLRAAVLLAAGVDLLRVLELSPKGRKALADFCGEPFLEETKGE